VTARLTVAYDGTDFAGWAVQRGRRTVASELARALATVLREEVDLVVAGRTDAGVHAQGQVVSYAGPLPVLRSVNAVLPSDVAVVTAEEAPEGFNARFDATSRRYAYRILHRRARSPFEARYSLHRHGPLDQDALHACAAALVGTHDFTAFTPTETVHTLFERTILEARWERTGDLLTFHVEAPAFMRNQNRILVGTMIEVATGDRTIENFTSLLDGAPREAAGPTAAPHGLHLMGVRYSDSGDRERGVASA
jgi:tRNA pseudouridine38-40 synthase